MKAAECGPCTSERLSRKESASIDFCRECVENLLLLPKSSDGAAQIAGRVKACYGTDEEEKAGSDVEVVEEEFSSCLFCGDTFQKTVAISDVAKSDNLESTETTGETESKTELSFEAESKIEELLVISPALARPPSRSELLFRCEPALLRHHICQFLSVTEVVRLRLVSKWIGTLLRGHELDLDTCPYTRRFMVSDLQQYFYSGKFRESVEMFPDGKDGASEFESQWTLKGIKLEISETSELQRLSQMTNVKSIKSLSLSFSPSSSTVLDFSSFAHVESLNFSHCKGLVGDSLASLFACGRLKMLNLGYCESLESIDHVNNLKQLRLLLLSGCKSLRDITAISGCEKLEELYLDRCTSLRLESFPGNLECLRKLSMRGCAALIYLPSSFKCLVRLEEADFSGCSALENVDILGHRNLNSLRTVNLLNCSSIQDVSFVKARRQSLESLILGYCSSLQNVDCVSSCEALRYLDISGCEFIKVPNSDRLHSLTTLIMVGCCSLKDVSGLSQCANLLELNLAGCRNLNSVDALHSCKSLETLNLALCSGLYSVAALAKSPSLRHIDIRWCTKIVKKSSRRLSIKSIILD